MHSYQDSLTYNNNKPWFTAKLSSIRPKKDAYRNGNRVLYKQAKSKLEKEMRVAKRNYSDKLRIQFSSSDTASVWKGLKDINYKTPSPSIVENQQLADDLKEFYCRFEKNTINTSTSTINFLTDRQQLVRQGKYTSSPPHHQHWRSSGLCSLPTTLLPLHQQLHI